MSTTPNYGTDPRLIDDEAAAALTIADKLRDALTPGFVAEFAPDEAERAGAFNEDALSEADATDSSVDLPALSGTSPAVDTYPSVHPFIAPPQGSSISRQLHDAGLLQGGFLIVPPGKTVEEVWASLETKKGE